VPASVSPNGFGTGNVVDTMKSHFRTFVNVKYDRQNRMPLTTYSTVWYIYFRPELFHVYLFASIQFFFHFLNSKLLIILDIFRNSLQTPLVHHSIKTTLLLDCQKWPNLIRLWTYRWAVTLKISSGNWFDDMNGTTLEICLQKNSN